MGTQRLVWPVLISIMSTSTPTLAQDMRAPAILTAAALRGETERPRPLGALPAAISSSSASWTEVAFPDGTSVVLERGADLVLQSVARDPGTQRWIIHATSTQGRLRIAASDTAEVRLTTGGATVRIPAVSAVVRSGVDGSVTLLSSGGEIDVQQGGRMRVLRRPSFSILFGDGGPQRQSDQQLTALIDSFAPVQAKAASLGNQPRPPVRPPALPAARVARVGCDAEQTAIAGLPQNNPDTVDVSPTPATLGCPDQTATAIQVNNPALPLPLPPEPPSQRSAQSFAVAFALVPLGPPPSEGSTIAAPSAGSDSATNDQSGFLDPLTGNPVDDATIRVDRTRVGTGRVRRFAPDSSGLTAGRSDTGIVTVANASGGPSATGPVGSFFQNLATSQLDGAPGQVTFYDALANVGIVQLTLSTNCNTGGGDCRRERSLTRISITDTASSPAGQTPSLTFIVPPLPGPPPPPLDTFATKQYFGSAVFENGVGPIGVGPTIPLDGQVSALAGPAGRVVFVESQSSFTPGFDRIVHTTLQSVEPSSNPGVLQQANTFDKQPRPADVFIIDKIHTQNSTGGENPDPRGIDPGERYFIIGGTAIPPVSVGQGLPGAPPGTVARFAISDGVNPESFDGGGTMSIADQFFLPPVPVTGQSAQPAAFRQYNAFRPDETFVAGAPRGDTHLLVISSNDGRNPALRTDFQIAANGGFSASASVGGISNFAGSLALSGATVGSSQLGPTEGAFAITSNLGSLGTDATGLAAQMFPGSDKALGQIGFFAVSQADSRQGAPGTPEGVQPGSVQAVGNPAKTSQFAYTRLATNVGAPPGLAPAGALNHDGFATGFVQSSANGQSSLYAVGSAALGDVHIASNPANTEFTATLAFKPTSVGDAAWDPAAAPAPNGVAGKKSVVFGNVPGGTPTTAVISTGTFAGVVPGKAAMASVDSDVIQGVANRTGTIVAPGTNQTVNADLPVSNEHLAWGFFLGDLANQAAGVQADHVNLGFWVAGRPVSLQALQSLTGTATYAGGMVANVAQQVGQVAQVKSVTGQFAEQWNFSNRTGSLNANFDGAQWNGVVTSMPPGSQVFTGSGTSGNARILAVQGAFFHATPTIQTPATALSAANTPSAVGGIFGIRGAGYGANGIMTGGRR